MAARMVDNANCNSNDSSLAETVVNYDNNSGSEDSDCEADMDSEVCDLAFKVESIYAIRDDKRQNKFSASLNDTFTTLNDCNKQFKAIRSERHRLIRQFREDMKQLSRTQLRLKKIVKSFQVNSMHPLKQLHEKIKRCNVCKLGFKGVCFVFFGCSHGICICCLTHYNSSKCPECRTEITSCYSVVKRGDRFVINQKIATFDPSKLKLTVKDFVQPLPSKRSSSRRRSSVVEITD